jgi:hypothetical protein
LHDWVSHGIKPLLLTVPSGPAAALAAGEDNEGGLGAVELIAGPVCGTTASGTRGSLRGNRLPVAHPLSAKIRNTATNLINSVYSFSPDFVSAAVPVRLTTAEGTVWRTPVLIYGTIRDRYVWFRLSG